MEDRLNPNRPPSNLNVGENLNVRSEPQEILQALLDSKQSGTAIGIISSALGSDIFTTTVEDIIIHENATLIVLKRFDTTGYILPSYKINLLEILGVWPL